MKTSAAKISPPITSEVEYMTIDEIIDKYGKVLMQSEIEELLKLKPITPSDFDCDLVRNERRKLYMEMAEYFLHSPKHPNAPNCRISINGVTPVFGICERLEDTGLLDDCTDKDELFEKFPEMLLIQQFGIDTYWFEGQQERSTALLLVYYAMDLADEGE